MAVAAELGERIGLIEHPGIHDANILQDRPSVEAVAWAYIANRADIPQPVVQQQEYQDNGRTVLLEALTESGHLSVVKLSGTPEEIEAQLLGRLLNGWDPTLPQHEQDRRFAEICNVLYGCQKRAAIIAGELPEDTVMLEFTNHPNSLRGAKLGYRDKNDKGMIRSSHLVNKGDGQYDLVIEQLSRSNSGDHSTFAFFEACGVEPADTGKPADLVALETPLIYSLHDYPGGVVDIMRRVDQHAGYGVLYGDTGAAKAKHVLYEDLREESQRRETEIECFTGDLAKLEKQLDGYVKRGQMTPRERINNLYGEIERILAAICTLEPGYAATTFGEKAAPSFYEAAAAAAQGDFAQAQRIIDDNVDLREEVSFCGGSISIKEAEELGLEVNSYEKLLKKGKGSWKWKNGVCAVKSCETRPGITKVGPCSVCVKCQHKFNQGRDPTKEFMPKIKRTRGERLSIAKPETTARLGRTILQSPSKLKRGDHPTTQSGDKLRRGGHHD